MSDDLKTLVAQEVAKQLAAIAADQTTKKVLEFLNQRISSVKGVVDSWTDGNGNWWRKYSDGWIEQGGKSDRTSEGPVSLNTSFSGTNYVAMIIPIDHVNQDRTVIKVYEKTTSTFNFVWWGATGGMYWFACGY